MRNILVKFGLKIPNRLGKNVRKSQGGIFFDSHCRFTTYLLSYVAILFVLNGYPDIIQAVSVHPPGNPGKSQRISHWSEKLRESDLTSTGECMATLIVRTVVSNIRIPNYPVRASLVTERWTCCCVQLTTDLLPYVQSCANPVIYSFMSQSFRRRVRAGWCQFLRCLRRDRDGSIRAGTNAGIEGQRLEELGADAGVVGSRRHVSFGSQSARRWSSTAAVSRNSRRKTGAATHLSVMTG